MITTITVMGIIEVATVIPIMMTFTIMRSSIMITHRRPPAEGQGSHNRWVQIEKKY